MSQAPPQYSPDGLHWWTGYEWVPVQPAASSAEQGAAAENRPNRAQLIRLTVEGLIGLLLVGVLVFVSLDQWQQANQQLITQVAAQKAQIALQKSEIDALQAQITDLKERWLGSPAIWQPPAIANTDTVFFDVKGSTQAELIDSLDNSAICTTYGPCASDPAVRTESRGALKATSRSTVRTCAIRRAPRPCPIGSP
jgi:cell division protein FtsB